MGRPAELPAAACSGQEMELRPTESGAVVVRDSVLESSEESGGAEGNTWKAGMERGRASAVTGKRAVEWERDLIFLGFLCGLGYNVAVWAVFQRLVEHSWVG
jgi:hypothetical protein